MFGVPKNEADEIYALAYAGATDREIDRAVYDGADRWPTRDISYVARRDAGLIPNRVGAFERVEDVRASDVRGVLAEAPKLRGRALVAVFGFEPTAKNREALARFAVVGKRPGRLAAGKYRA
jgi:hypothetical protein